MRDILKTYFGYDSFRPLQEDVIRHLLERKDALVLMPTGGGKSLCYQLPALCLDGVTLVVSPLIALMKDQVDALRANGIEAEFINSTLSRVEITSIEARVRQGWVKILYVAPERLSLPGFRQFLRSLKLSLIAIDEAHCISEWGHDFRPEYRNLKTLREDFPGVPIVALTATATEQVRQDIIQQLRIPAAQTFLLGFNRPNLTYRVEPKREAFRKLLDLLSQHRDSPAIVYCISRKDSENLAEQLSSQGFRALAYHAGLDGATRRANQEEFARDEVSIVVATIAFGMGIDKPDIRLIVHYDIPRSLEGYYQETGRAGRDGLPSECVMFYSYGDKIKHDFFIDKIYDPSERQNAREKLAKVIEFCGLSGCRRRYLLDYFGEHLDGERCDACDICLSSTEEFDATVIAQKLLSAVVRTGQSFGVKHVCDVLRGANTKQVRRFGHDALSVYGVARDHSEDEVKEVVSLLVHHGLLTRNGAEYPTLTVTEQGWRFLRQRETLVLTRPRRQTQEERGHTAAQEYDRALFERLRGLRKRLADIRGVRPFVIFGDATLQQMATYLPQDADGLLQITGVGRAKLAEFGDVFLEEITEYARQHGIAPRPISPPRPGRSGASRRNGSTYEETRRLIEQGLSIGEIARERGLAESTVIGHLERLVTRGDDLDVQRVLPPPDRCARIRAAFQQAGTLSLTPVKELLGEDYSYEEIRLVRMGLHQGQGVLR